jgi:RTX calcium-binding nonapeptide repeat (4 copies)
MRFVARIAMVSAVAALFVPAGQASAAVRNFPGTCGATLEACITAVPAGTTIRLRTNALIAIPDTLDASKALSLEAAPGFRPKIGRTGSVIAELAFSVPAGNSNVSIRGITFRQVRLTVSYFSGRHKTVFSGNTVRLSSGFNNDDGFSVSYGTVAFGPISILNNDISASGNGLRVWAQDGTVTIAGNTLTSPRVGDSETGLLFTAAIEHVKAVVANNVVHHVGDCNCGLSNGLNFSVSDLATLDLWLVNNTISNIGTSPSGSFSGVLLRPPSATPGHANVRLYNNVIAHVNMGVQIESGATLVSSGGRNNIFATTTPTVLNSHSIGPILHTNPRFKNTNGPNYRLMDNSPLANAAAACVPGLVLPRGDAGGRFRYFGPGLDIGAFERGSTVSGSANGVSKTGTNSANRMVGTSGRDVLCGLGGNDRLFGRGNGDFLVGGLGRDRVFGGGGNDRIDLRDGVRGNDEGDGGPGLDVCRKDANDRRTSC